MSLHISAVSIEGDARASLEDLFTKCEYEHAAPPETVDGWSSLQQAMPRPEDKGTVYHNSRTTIIDPELTIMLDEGPMKDLSRQFGSVLTMVCEGVSATYGFALYRNGKKIRSLTATDGNIVEQSGDPLPEESGVDAASLSEDVILELLSKLGFDYSDLENACEFRVYHLESAGDVPAESSAEPQPKSNTQLAKKPWWKLW